MKEFQVPKKDMPYVLQKISTLAQDPYLLLKDMKKNLIFIKEINYILDKNSESELIQD